MNGVELLLKNVTWISFLKDVRVGPYSNRQETYAYFSLPFCRGPKQSISHYHETMGESLLGVELDFSGLDIKFRTNTKKTVFCKMKLTNEAYQTFVYAIKNSYFYQMYLDDMPIWGHCMPNLQPSNQMRSVVDVNLTSGGHVAIHPGVELEFTYEVKWVASPVPFADRFDKYLDPSFFQHRIHWFSIFNSFMMVVFLVGLVWMILVRTLRKDYARYQKEDSIDDLVCGVAFLINFIAIYYHASRAIPFTVMLAVTAICLFVILPLTLVGTVLGRNMSGQGDYPCRVNAVPRPIPDKKWFVQPWLIVLMGGVLPFGSIFIEMYFIFTSFWAYKIYYVYGFMLLVTIILAIVTVCVTIVCSYFLLNAEDYRWRWTSFMAGASTALYVYLYSVYYFFFKTKMYGLFQTVFYFGYMGIFSAALGLMTGTIGYVGTAKFVRKIYSTVKID
ncbi:endomembrane protein 70 [Ostertagia ostertagi]